MLKIKRFFTCFDTLPFRSMKFSLIDLNESDPNLKFLQRLPILFLCRCFPKSRWRNRVKKRVAVGRKLYLLISFFFNWGCKIWSIFYGLAKITLGHPVYLQILLRVMASALSCSFSHEKISTTWSNSKMWVLIVKAQKQSDIFLPSVFMGRQTKYSGSLVLIIGKLPIWIPVLIKETITTF